MREPEGAESEPKEGGGRIGKAMEGREVGLGIHRRLDPQLVLHVELLEPRRMLPAPSCGSPATLRLVVDPTSIFLIALVVAEALSSIAKACVAVTALKIVLWLDGLRRG